MTAGPLARASPLTQGDRARTSSRRDQTRQWAVVCAILAGSLLPLAIGTAFASGAALTERGQIALVVTAFLVTPLAAWVPGRLGGPGFANRAGPAIGAAAVFTAAIVFSAVAQISPACVPDDGRFACLRGEADTWNLALNGVFWAATLAGLCLLSARLGARRAQRTAPPSAANPGPYVLCLGTLSAVLFFVPILGAGLSVAGAAVAIRALAVAGRRFGRASSWQV